MNIHFCYDVAARKRAEKMLEHSDPNKKVFTIWGITTVIDSTIPIYDGVYLNLVDFKVTISKGNALAFCAAERAVIVFPVPMSSARIAPLAWTRKLAPTIWKG